MAALTPAVFHILLALAQGERHGYGILKDVLEQTDGDVRLGPGTLYGTLQRLMEAGLVEEVPGIAPDADHDSRRRYYRITKTGPPCARRRCPAHGFTGSRRQARHAGPFARMKRRAAVPRGLTASERIYRLLLRLYPPSFRREFGHEMTLDFDEAGREAWDDAPVARA